MADSFIQVPVDSTGKKVDASQLNVGANVVQRQRHVIADSTDPLGLAVVKGAAPGAADMGLAVRPIVTDGFDANAGATTDAAVVADANGSLSGKLRGIVKILADVWNGALHTLMVSVTGNVAVTNAALDTTLSSRLKPADTLAGVTAVGSITNALPAGANVIGHVIMDGGSTTAVTGNVAITNANLDAAISTRLKPADTLAGLTTVGTVNAVTAITNALPVGANIIGKVGIDAAVTGGLALEAGNVATILARTPALGAAVSAAASPVVLASDQVQSKTVQPNDNDLGILVRQIGEDNSYTQMLLNQLSGMLFKVFNMTAAAGTPALNVLAIQPTAASLNVTLAANQTMSVSQVSAVAVANVTGAQAPSITQQTAALPVAPTQSYHLPIIPMHIYDPGAIIV